MKKLVLMSLCAVLCLQITACSNLAPFVGGKDTAEENPNAGVAISDKLESGELAIDGGKYTFPSGISEWTGNGWHISSQYGNADTFELEYNVESNEFEVFNDEKGAEYVRMRAINFERTPTKIGESATAYLEVSVSGNKDALAVMLPGGITCASTREDVVNAYGEPQEEEDGTLYYTYTNEDGLDIIVGISVTYGNVNSVVYVLADSNWGSVASAEECAEFIDSALKVSFYGEFESYVENKFDTEEGAKGLYEYEIGYYAEVLMYYLDIDYETVDDGIAAGFCEISEQVLNKVKWDTPIVDLADGAVMGEFEITLYPVDFLDIIVDEAQAVSDSGLVDNEYAQGMLDAISPKVDEISYKEPITRTYDIDMADGVIAQEDWDEIDMILMDIAE